VLKIWKQPSVAVLACSKLEPVSADFATWTINDDSHVSELDALGEVAGRVCYMSQGKGRKTNAAYLQNILTQQHESVLEHSTVTFGIQGISRACSHEIVRHRHLSFSQLSQRYVTGRAEYVYHPSTANDTDFGDFLQSIERIVADEIRLAEERGLGHKQATELARMVLPNMTETKMVVTGNLRAWRHFVTIRGGVGADREIRRLACVILRHLKAIAPNSFMDIEEVDGIIVKRDLDA